MCARRNSPLPSFKQGNLFVVYRVWLDDPYTTFAKVYLVPHSTYHKLRAVGWLYLISCFIDKKKKAGRGSAGKGPCLPSSMTTWVQSSQPSWWEEQTDPSHKSHGTLIQSCSRYKVTSKLDWATKLAWPHLKRKDRRTQEYRYTAVQRREGKRIGSSKPSSAT